MPEEHYINGRRAYTEREATEILRLPHSTVQAAIARGELRTAQGHMSRYILGPELRRFADRRGLQVRLPDDLTDEEREELEQLRAEARAREQRENLEGVQRYYRSLRGDDGTTDEGEEDEPSLAESIAAARERWDAECAQRDREHEAEERAARAEIQRETRERQEAEIARLARELEERNASTEAER